MKMATAIRDVFVLVGFVLASTTANAQESASLQIPLLEQLQAEESAAANEAQKVRDLKASGSELDSDRLIELDRKLKTHLEAAFDLKLQLEERQVKALQTRLSQLESQIGQRKQLREKIIARRAAELIEGAALEWSEPNNLIEPKSVRYNDKDSISVVGPVGTDPNAGQCDLVSPPPPVDVLRELERQRGVQPGAISNSYELHKDSIRIVVEPVFDHIDPPMTFPLIGRASLHRLRWRVTVTFKPKAGVTWPFKERADGKIEETFNIDAVHLHKLDEPTNTKSPIEELRTPEQFQADLEPLLLSLKSCEQRMRESEAAYYNDNSNAAELQAAWDALMQVEEELKAGALPIKDAIRVVSEQRDIAKEASMVLHTEQVAMLSQLAKDEATEAEVEAARKAYASFEDVLGSFDTKLRLLINLRTAIPQRRDHEKYFQFSTFEKELSPSTDNHDPVDALIWLEAGFNAKLEFVKFDNLNLPIKAALRVRESTGKYQPGDLIFAIKGYSFETFDQAVTAALSDRSVVTNLLRSGLLGDVYPGNFDGQLRYLRHSGGSDVTFNLEVPLVSPESGETRIRYMQGICVSLEGLAVVPSLITSIEEGKSIKIYGTTRGTASVVAIDEVHKLTLLKLDIPDQKLVSWTKCLTSMPSKGQRLSVLYEFAPPNNGSHWTAAASVSAINQDYSALPDCHDAFTLNNTANAQAGAMVISIDGEMQGILLEKSESVPEPGKTSPHACLPAIHIEALRAKYRAR